MGVRGLNRSAFLFFGASTAGMHHIFSGRVSVEKPNLHLTQNLTLTPLELKKTSLHRTSFKFFFQRFPAVKKALRKS